MRNKINVFNKIEISIDKVWNKFMKYPKTVMLLGLVVVLFSPIICSKWPFKNFIIYILGNKENAIAYMQYFGALIGGIATLITLYITINETRRIQKINNNRQESIEAKTYMPILDLSKDEVKVNNIHQLMKIYKETGVFYFFINLKNIGDSLCNIDDYKLTYCFQDKNNETKQVVEDQVKTNDEVSGKSVNCINKGESKVITIQAFHDEITARTKIMPILFITFYITSALGYRYKQVFIINGKSEESLSCTEKMFPEWIS